MQILARMMTKQMCGCRLGSICGSSRLKAKN